MRQLLLLALASLFVCSCSQNTPPGLTGPVDSGSGNAPGTPDGGDAGRGLGSLRVTFNGLDGGQGSVTVAGPEGFHAVVGQPQTLTGLTPGAYTVAPGVGALRGRVVRTVLDAEVAGTPAEVAAGATATVDVTWTPRAGAGLWVALSSPFAFLRLTDAELASPPSAVDAGLSAVLPAPRSLHAEAVAVDGHGNFWFTQTTPAPSTVRVYAREQLARVETTDAGTPPFAEAPRVVLSSAAPQNFLGMAFDAHGNLFLTRVGSPALVEYAASALTAGSGLGAPSASWSFSPAVTLTALAFDAAGNLWLATPGGVGRMSGDQLAASGSAVTLAPFLPAPGSETLGLAFDAQGNLWVPDFGRSTVRRFSAATLGQGAHADLTLDLADAGAPGPHSLAFDEQGNLWVDAYLARAVVRYGAAPLLDGGAVQPDFILSVGAANSGWLGMAFNPPAPTLPLVQPTP